VATWIDTLHGGGSEVSSSRQKRAAECLEKGLSTEKPAQPVLD